MTRYVDPFPQYLNSSGSPIVGGFLKFFESQTSTPKNVYEDPLFTIPLGSEVRLDSSGRIPTIFLSGAYRVVLTDKDGNQLDDADPIGVDTNVTAFDLWLVGTTYNEGDIVTGSDDLYYQSIFDSNLGNDPTSTSGFWEQVLFQSMWADQETYAQGELVIASDGRTYQSQSGANQGNDPTSASPFWEILLQSNETVLVGGVDINKLTANASSIRFLVSDVQRWQFLFDTDDSFKLNLYDSGGVLDTTILELNESTGDTTWTGNLALTGTVDITGDTSILESNLTVSQDGQASAVELKLTSDASQQAAIAFQDATVDRWVLGQTLANSFSLARYNASGVIQGTPWFVADGTDNVEFNGNILFSNTNQGFEVVSPNGGTMDFNFTDLDTDNAAFEFFDNTSTTGTRLLNIYQGDGTATITFQIDAETGTIFPSFDRSGVGETGVKLGKITLSTAAPSGGEDGDLWLRY